ncbi:putative autophagy-related protein 11 [Uloborus diversus]|uniref:putative autophagy-related protein 11 n=1 Tax=Uloborus diversus TaxID=327109 RepID=UPI0024091110|nr:putative autophagy-related protein 11 [Uloborus diversus]
MASDSEDEIIKNAELNETEDVLKLKEDDLKMKGDDELKMQDYDELKCIVEELKLKKGSDLKEDEEDGLLVKEGLQLKGKKTQLKVKEGESKTKDEVGSKVDYTTEVQLETETEHVILKKTKLQEKDDLETKEIDSDEEDAIETKEVDFEEEDAVETKEVDFEEDAMETKEVDFEEDAMETKEVDSEEDAMETKEVDFEEDDEMEIKEFDSKEKGNEEQVKKIEFKEKDDEFKLREKLRIEQELKMKEDELKMKENELRTKENELKMKENELKMKENALKTKEVELKMKGSDDSNQKESQFSYFTVDGVVAEMDIEVEEDNDFSLHKELKLHGINSNGINEIDLTFEDSDDEIDSIDMSIVKKETDVDEETDSLNCNEKEAIDEKKEIIEPSVSQPKQFKKRGRKRKIDLLNNDGTEAKHLHFEKGNDKTEKIPLETSAVEINNPGSKKHTLRKLPFRQNSAAPDVPDLQQKVIWINDVGEGRGIHLGNLPKLRKQLLEAKRKLRLLYKLLYFQVPPNDPNVDVVKTILKFNGFPFDESSFEFVKRRRVLAHAGDSSILSICKMLSLKKGSKQDMIKSILKFLMKPHGKLDPPDDPIMQPRVVLERISLATKYLKSALYTSKHDPETKKSKASAPQEAVSSRYNLKDKSKISWNKRDHRFTKIEDLPPRKSTAREPDKGKEGKSAEDRKTIETRNKLAEKKKQELSRFEEERKEHAERRQLSEQKKLERKKQEEKRKQEEEKKNQGGKKKLEEKKKLEKQKELEEEKKKLEEEKKKLEEEKKKIENKKKEKKKEVIETTSNKSIDLKKNKKNVEGSAKKSKQTNLTSKQLEDIGEKDVQKSIQIMKSPDKVKDENLQPKNTENIEKIESPVEDVSFLSDNEDTDDAPESQKEMSEQENLTTESSAVQSETEKKTPTKRVIRLGKPLRMFPKINERMKNASVNVLQRLHILLFGAFEKAANLKPNILAFGGFPFVEGSEEWNQKQFLMSLLAQNTLREYLDLLCIEYSGNDQKTMISKLMKFLTAPNEKALGQTEKKKDNTKEKSKAVPSAPTPIDKKKSVKKEAANKEVKKKPTKEPSVNPRRKVLMDEAQVRRMEADIAREQRILAREKKLNEEQMEKYMSARLNKTSTLQKAVLPGKTLAVTNLVPPTKPPIADPEQLNALLQTVYKRRALKAAGAVISTPKKEKITRLGDIPNVKFLIVTGNYSDLAMLHHLIYMTDTNKAKVRKNILDFCGFGFTEESNKYKERMVFLNSVGYDLSKRIAFLLGLCPYQTTIAQQDLNELILYFLMSPCRTKQVPITQFPQELLDQSCKTKPVLTKSDDSIITTPSSVDTLKDSPEKDRVMVLDPPNPDPIDSPNFDVVPRQKAKKSVNGSFTKLHSVKKVLLPSAPAKPALLNRVPSLKMPSPVKQATAPTLFIPPPGSSTPRLQIPQSIQNSPQLQVNKVAAPLDELFFQQQTPDGQQKTYKLIRLPQNHPLATTVMRNTAQQIGTLPSPPAAPLHINTSFTSALPPGIILVKNKAPSLVSQAIPNISFSTPLRASTPILRPQPIAKAPSKEEYVLPDAGGSSSTGANTIQDDDVQILPHLKKNPPSDNDLYNCLQDIIHSSNFENMTLKNVLDEVCAKFSNHDLSQRHSYMKECIKSIIMGT